MHNEKYKELMLRFAKEMHEVGVTENMRKITESQGERTPNTISCGTDETTRKFYYQHGGYSIEAVQTVKLTLKKCS